MDLISPEGPLYGWFGLNRQLFLLINGLHSFPYDQLMVVASWLGHPRMFPVYVTLALWLSWRKPGILAQRSVVIFATGYMIISMFVVPLTKFGLDFPRPIAELGAHIVTVIGDQDGNHSFPSGHAAFAVLLASSLATGGLRNLKFALAAFAVLVCFSRVAVGAHFPADVLGGAVLSLLVVSGLKFVLPEELK